METVEVTSSKSSCKVENEVEDRPSSPVNDCAICLEQLTDKSFTNSCFHMFCFHCLKEWSKVKPECPLCKQDFCSIIHNIRSMDDYDEYRVPPAAMRFATPDATPFSASTFSQNSLSLPFRDILRQRDFFSPSRRFFSYRTTYIPGPFNVPRERSPRLVIQPYVDNLQIQNNYPGISSSLSNTSNLSNRKDVYLNSLEIRPSNDSRHRLSSPEFYRENEGQLHRLGRWINRELAAISQLGIHFDSDGVFALIMHLLPNYDIQSTRFYSSLFPNLGYYTRRFIKEFYHFAISPYDMEEYDRMTVYIHQRTGSSLAFIVSVGSDESEDVQVIPSPSVSHSTISPWVNLTRCPASNYTSSIINNSSRLSSSPSTCPYFSSTSTSGSSTSQQIIDISDSENDDCIIIDEVKTTPQTIILDDSDTESPDSGIAPRSPVPGTSGYQPPPKTTIVEKSISSISHYDFKLGTDSSSSENSCPSSCFRKNARMSCSSTIPRKRSASSSSVISTDNSVIDYNSDTKHDPKEKRRKQFKPKKIDSPREYDSFLSSSEFSFNCDDDNDSDWQANPKKKKKTKKHSNKSDKKSHKRKKVARTKSPKRKIETTHKSKHVSKSRKLKNSLKSTADCSSASKTTNGSGSNSSTHDSNFSPIRPRLRSVVKKVDRGGHFDDNLPSTSYGFRCNSITQMLMHSRKSFYSSDSD